MQRRSDAACRVAKPSVIREPISFKGGIRRRHWLTRKDGTSTRYCQRLLSNRPHNVNIQTISRADIPTGLIYTSETAWVSARRECSEPASYALFCMRPSIVRIPIQSGFRSECPAGFVGIRIYCAERGGTGGSQDERRRRGDGAGRKNTLVLRRQFELRSTGSWRLTLSNQRLGALVWSDKTHVESGPYDPR